MSVISLFTASSCVAGPAGVACRLLVYILEASVGKPTEEIQERALKNNSKGNKTVKNIAEFFLSC